MDLDSDWHHPHHRHSQNDLMLVTGWCMKCKRTVYLDDEREVSCPVCMSSLTGVVEAENPILVDVEDVNAK